MRTPSKTRRFARPRFARPRATSFVQTFGLPGLQLYATRAAGCIANVWGPMRNRRLLLNNGGGAKINLAGPIRARVDYRIFNLKGNPRHKTVQRIYAGLNLKF